MQYLFQIIAPVTINFCFVTLLLYALKSHLREVIFKEIFFNKQNSVTCAFTNLKYSVINETASKHI